MANQYKQSSTLLWDGCIWRDSSFGCTGYLICVKNINQFNWKTQDDYLKSLNQKNRYSVKKEILKYEDCFEIEFDKPNSNEEINKCYQLYENVYHKSLDLNVFKLPKVYFENICKLDEYDFIKLYCLVTKAKMFI